MSETPEKTVDAPATEAPPATSLTADNEKPTSWADEAEAEEKTQAPANEQPEEKVAVEDVILGFADKEKYQQQLVVEFADPNSPIHSIKSFTELGKFMTF